MPPQQAAMASQQEATALMTISGEAAKAAVPEARSRRPAIVKVLFIVKSVSIIWKKAFGSICEIHRGGGSSASTMSDLSDVLRTR